MAATAPERKFLQIPFSGVWDESTTPTKLGASGLTVCQNISYRRYGSWGKRSGSLQAYQATALGTGPGPYASGIRWARAFPSPLTRLVVAQQGQIYTGLDPNTTRPAPLTPYTGADVPSALNLTVPVRFASVRDPAAGSFGVGSDVLVMTGITGNFSFPMGTVFLGGNFVAGQMVTLATSLGTFTQSYTYTTLATDNNASVAVAVVAGYNAVSTGVFAPAVVLTASAAAASIAVAGQISHPVGIGSYTYGIVVTGIGGGGSPTGATMSAGNTVVSAPVKYDGTTMSGLSPYIQQPFTGVVNWHNHLWFWGDPSNPDSLYASDINEPEGFTFMIQNGPYFIGQGDGDPGIRAVVPIGNILYIFKSHTIYAVTGYDFQSGEYAFSVQPALTGYGTPALECVAVLRNSLVFWTGRKFARLAVGAYEAEVIGAPLPVSQGKIALGQQNLMRAVAGSFVAQSSFNESYDPQTLGNVATEVLEDQAYFACDIGNGIADTIFVYDDAASIVLTQYAWSPWTGLTVGAWIPFMGSVPTATDPSKTDAPLLLFMPPPSSMPPQVFQFGAHPTADSGVPIAWQIQTGWLVFSSTALTKELHRIFLEFSTTPSTTFVMTIITQGYPDRLVTFSSVGGVAGVEQYQIELARINPFLKSSAYLFRISERSAASTFEVVSLVLDYIESPFVP